MMSASVMSPRSHFKYGSQDDHCYSRTPSLQRRFVVVLHFWEVNYFFANFSRARCVDYG
jgi:hypothetical protein